ncbi:MAG: DUF92 domain-containing protein [Gemmatimonadaceae bacterium]
MPLTTVLLRTIGGFALALCIARVAYRRGALSASGARAAVLSGSVAATAGVRWALLLIAYFFSAVAVTHWRHGRKTARARSLVAKPGARDARQVFANGAVFSVAAVGAAITGNATSAAAALGALATSAADTWATEIGSACDGDVRMPGTWRRVPVGRSGGVSAAGTVALFLGSVVFGMFAAALGFSADAVRGAVVGGVVGALADSLLGGIVQERRQCLGCSLVTERRTHECREGVVSDTQIVGGVRGFDNDWVNLTSTAVGAVVAALISRGGA